jgi:hypothetical protein
MDPRRRALRSAALGLVFGGSALSAFIVARPTIAAAASRSVPIGACTATGVIGSIDYECPITTGSDLSTATYNRYYFDFYSVPGGNVQLVAVKRSYAGTYYQDYLMVASGSLTPGANDKTLIAVNTKLAPSVWDYVTLEMLGTGGGIGVAVLTN